jgi:hypothetical protein
MPAIHRSSRAQTNATPGMHRGAHVLRRSRVALFVRAQPPTQLGPATQSSVHFTVGLGRRAGWSHSALPRVSGPSGCGAAPCGPVQWQLQSLGGAAAGRRHRLRVCTQSRWRGLCCHRWRFPYSPAMSAKEAMPPNHSFKRTPNSVARQPSSAGPAAHFALAVWRATL